LIVGFKAPTFGNGKCTLNSFLGKQKAIIKGANFVVVEKRQYLVFNEIEGLLFSLEIIFFILIRCLLNDRILDSIKKTVNRLLLSNLSFEFKMFFQQFKRQLAMQQYEQ
jgi:hypothetical protein